jgi:hypothetical protein
MDNCNNNNNNNSYIRVNHNTIINENTIRWVLKMSECLEICMKHTGCDNGATVQICKDTNPISYEKLNKYFD